MDATSWTHSGLATNSQYAFQVCATNAYFDSAKTANYAAWTAVEAVTGLTFSSIGTNSIGVTCSNTLSRLDVGSSGLSLENVTSSADSGWKHDATPWISTGLSPNTAYQFRARSRNAASVETAPVTASRYTLAATPVAPAVSSPGLHTLLVAVVGDGNPAATAYAIQLAPAVGGGTWVQADGTVGAADVYRTAAQWGIATVSGLAENTLYAFRAVARNGDGVVTAAGPTSESRTLDGTPPNPPVVTGVTPTNDPTPGWTWTSGGGDGAGVFRCQVDSEDGAWTETTALVYEVPSALSEGPHTLYVRERDTAGNWSVSGSFAITIDITPPGHPTVTGTTPTNDATPSWTWTAGGGGEGVFRCRVDGGAWSGELAATAYSPIAPLGEGTRTLEVQERDGAGNWSTSGSFAIVIDTTPPHVTVEQQVGQVDPTDELPIRFAVSFSEPVTGFGHGNVSRGGSATGVTFNVSGTGADYVISVTAASSGTVYFTVPAGGAYDTAGNANLASTSLDNTVTYTPLGVLTFAPRIGLSVGGTVLTLQVFGSPNDIDVYLGAVPCIRTSGAKSGSIVVATPSVPPGHYTVRVVNTASGDEMTATDTFEVTDNPFASGVDTSPGSIQEIEDGNPDVTTAIGSAAEDGAGHLMPLHYESPEDVVVDVPVAALPTNATGAFLVVRTSARLDDLHATVGLPSTLSVVSPALDIHVLVELNNDHAVAYELQQVVDAPASIRLPVTQSPVPNEVVLGALSTDLDSQLAPTLPLDPVLQVEAPVDLDVANRALFDATHFTTYALMGALRPADVNADGAVNSVDIQLAVNAVLGFDITPWKADVNGDGATNAIDIQSVINTVLGII